ncbi:MAG: DNA replication/repair protein RecF [Gammaproteobacteria bacterium]|nr:DNA replication/repair protein RecF [Gammaproteobacteria bacterium]
MAINRLEIQALRNIERVDIQPGAGINFLIGANGSGKTTVLEALYCLGRGRSFRTTQSNQLITHQSECFTVVGRFTRGHIKTVIGIQRSRGRSVIKVDGANAASAAQLASLFPITVIGPGLKGLLDDGPEPRRKFLDWGVFHVEHNFGPAWNRYRRALAQRNAALRSRNRGSIVSGWDAELVQYGNQLTQARARYLQQLDVYIKQLAANFSECAALAPRFYSGWPEGSDYADYLSDHLLSDLERGFTQFGPHRADLKFYIDGKDAKTVISRGQQKTWVAALTIAQCQQLHSVDIRPTLLVDDLPAELDPHRRRQLIQTLHNTGCQVFITATEKSLFTPEDISLGRVFHVEHGAVTLVED